MSISLIDFVAATIVAVLQNKNISIVLRILNNTVNRAGEYNKWNFSPAIKFSFIAVILVFNILHTFLLSMCYSILSLQLNATVNCIFYRLTVTVAVVLNLVDHCVAYINEFLDIGIIRGPIASVSTVYMSNEVLLLLNSVITFLPVAV